MKLKRICKVTYDAQDQLVIPTTEKLKYDLYFIDSEDWLCIDEDDYTPEKNSERDRERFSVYKDNGNGIHLSGFIYAPYVPLQFTDPPK